LTIVEIEKLTDARSARPDAVGCFPIFRFRYVMSDIVRSSRMQPASFRRICGSPRGARNVCERVTDDGPGIPAEALPQVFDKFIYLLGRRDACV
jgi:signal transduction histidine kinase